MSQIYIIRESIKQSIISDIATFSFIIFTFWFNYNFINGNNFIDFFIVMCVGAKVISCGACKKFKGVSEEKIKKIEKILEENNNGK